MVRDDVERTSMYIKKDSLFKLKEYALYERTTVTNILNDLIDKEIKRRESKKKIQ